MVIPCKNCIVLPICKQKFISFGSLPKSLVLELLFHKCSLLDGYLRSNVSHQFDDRSEKTINFLTGKTGET
jgi:hypothetical protein